MRRSKLRYLFKRYLHFPFILVMNSMLSGIDYPATLRIRRFYGGSWEAVEECDPYVYDYNDYI